MTDTVSSLRHTARNKKARFRNVYYGMLIFKGE